MWLSLECSHPQEHKKMSRSDAAKKVRFPRQDLVMNHHHILPCIKEGNLWKRMEKKITEKIIRTLPDHIRVDKNVKFSQTGNLKLRRIDLRPLMHKTTCTMSLTWPCAIFFSTHSPLLVLFISSAFTLPFFSHFLSQFRKSNRNTRVKTEVSTPY